MHPSMSPKGVEHSARHCWTTTGAPVHPSMSPKGVEHELATAPHDEFYAVHPSMSPKGVEHRVGPVAVVLCQRRASINVAERR